jgi:hypothetical protein
MIWWNHIFEIELIEKTVLPTSTLAHHHRDLSLTPSALENHSTPSPSKDFFNKLSQERKFAANHSTAHCDASGWEPSTASFPDTEAS